MTCVIIGASKEKRRYLVPTIAETEITTEYLLPTPVMAVCNRHVRLASIHQCAETSAWACTPAGPAHLSDVAATHTVESHWENSILVSAVVIIKMHGIGHSALMVAEYRGAVAHLRVADAD